MTPQEIISDEEIARVHAHGNFGAMSPREVVNEGVRKTAAGYHCGSTQLHILLEHGLATKPRPGSSDVSLTKKGKAYARSIYCDTAPTRAEAMDEGVAEQRDNEPLKTDEGGCVTKRFVIFNRPGMAPEKKGGWLKDEYLIDFLREVMLLDCWTAGFRATVLELTWNNDLWASSASEYLSAHDHAIGPRRARKAWEEAREKHQRIYKTPPLMPLGQEIATYHVRTALSPPPAADAHADGMRIAVEALEDAAHEAHGRGYVQGFADAVWDNTGDYDEKALTENLDPEKLRDGWYDDARHTYRDAQTKVLAALKSTDDGQAAP